MARVFSVHAPFSKMTPYGRYRSRQVYRDANQQVIGCLDTKLLYCETPNRTSCRNNYEASTRTH